MVMRAAGNSSRAASEPRRRPRRRRAALDNPIAQPRPHLAQRGVRGGVGGRHSHGQYAAAVRRGESRRAAGSVGFRNRRRGALSAPRTQRRRALLDAASHTLGNCMFHHAEPRGTFLRTRCLFRWRLTKCGQHPDAASAETPKKQAETRFRALGRKVCPVPRRERRRHMFETAAIPYGSASKRLWTACLGMTGQTALAGLAILIPMLHPSVLPRPQAL